MFLNTLVTSGALTKTRPLAVPRLASGISFEVLSLSAAIVRGEPPPLPFVLRGALWAVAGLLKLEPNDEWPLDCGWLYECPQDGRDRWLAAGASAVILDRENGITPARRAISASPSCQCIASAARHGTAISSATLDHISGLNLNHW
jgi:hypothetical protein